MVDPLKVEEINKFPPLRTIRQLQSLKGKENFLRNFVPNYANITKRFYTPIEEGGSILLGKSQHNFPLKH